MTASELHPGVLHHVVNTLQWPGLRPLQEAAIEPVRSGQDCLLLAPTAGGKTEAAVFPLLSEMADSSWQGMSVLYLTPLRALLNNLHPRLGGYASWLGRSVGLWHGDTGPSERQRLLRDPPDILLTTPESLEAMLVSPSIDHRVHFAHLQAVVVDELHAFAGDDRGWHLLAVLERLQRIAGRRLQRIGLTATVGNPAALLDWLQGSTNHNPGVVVAPQSNAPSDPDITVDFVGTLDNAATVVAALHQGEKRLVFSDSRAQAEEMAVALIERGITTFVSHSSLSAAERRRSEEAFAEARDCVVVATSTLELGIDVGDLDRVIQLEAPRTVASFLQRLGRTGRRSGTTRNCLFLATRESTLLRANALLHLWQSGFVEQITAPPLPIHIAAQQFLALALQEGRFGTRTWREWWGDLPVMEEGQRVLDYLLDENFLNVEADLAFIGHEAERNFGRRHFMELLSAFTSDPQMVVFRGRTELGSIAALSLSQQMPQGQSRILLLSGRTWLVTEIDWKRRRVQVVEVEGTGKTRWASGSPQVSHELARATRDVLLGSTPQVEHSHRATKRLERIRIERTADVDPDSLILQRFTNDAMWWTFAGSMANNSLARALTALGVEASADAEAVKAEHLDVETIRRLADVLDDPTVGARIDPAALDGLKFSAALPMDIAVGIIAARTTDPVRAKEAVASPLTVLS